MTGPHMPDATPIVASDPVFAQVVDELRDKYRPGVPDDQVPPFPAHKRTDAPQRPLYLAACNTCSRAGENLGEPPAMAVPFGSEGDRDRWASGHAISRQHRVSLVEQHPVTGSTITGYVDPPAVGTVKTRPPALLAFIVREGQAPDMLCNIPQRAGAAWFLTAAHACLLGGGTVGIANPHRALLIGRMTLCPEVGPGVEPRLPRCAEIAIDGLLGADGHPELGASIGRGYHVDATLDPASAEDVVEGRISDELGVARNLFSVIIIAGGPVNEPPDEHSDALLRDIRRAARDAYREQGGTPADAVAEFVDRPTPSGG